METRLVIDTLRALQEGQYRANRAMMEASGGTEEQLKEYDKTYQAMRAMHEHTENLLELVEALGKKQSIEDRRLVTSGQKG